MCRNISGECSCTGGGGGGGDATSLQGATWQSPLGIGTVAPAAGNFTTSSIITATITTANVTTENVSVCNVTTQLNALAINVSGLSANQLVSTDGSKNLVSSGVTSVLPSSNSVVKRDVDSNVYANNFVALVNTIITAGGTTTLTTASAQNILFTGTTTQNIKMPKANDWLVTGASFDMNNNSTGIITVRNFGAGIIGVIPGGGSARVVNIDISNANGVWDIHAYLPAGPTWGTAALITPTVLTTTDSTNATSTITGSIQTAGGVGIVKDLWVGGVIYMGGSQLPTAQNRVTLWMDDSIVTVGNALSFLATSTVPYNWRVFQSAAAINDSFYQTFVLKPGTYTMNVIGQQDTNKAIQTWYIDGVSQGTMDWYRASSLNLLMTMSVTVVGTGIHTLTSTALSKNASSTGYQIFIQKISMF